jgi:tetratricopeptide (TPR) repeat protein
MQIQELLNKAGEKKKEGDFVGALSLYKEALGGLTDEASEYARNVPETRIDDGDTRTILPSLFTEVEKYLRKDNVYCTILNNMGVIYAETGDVESARHCFEDSIKFTPEGVDYPNPKAGLKELQK